MLDGLDEALRGMSAGDATTFTSKLAGGDLEGQDVEVEVSVTAVKEQQLPDLDDDFAQMASEFDTIDELTDDVRVRLGNGKRLEQASAARDAVLEKVLDLTEVPVPEALVAEELTARRQSIEQQLAMAGMTMDQYLDSEEQTVDEFEGELEKRVRDAVAAQFVLDEIANAQEVGVEQQELTEHMLRRAQQSGQNPNEYVQHMVEHNHLPDLVAEVRRGKALASVVEAAVVTDASGNRVELQNLQPDGTIGEPQAEDPVADEGSAEAAAATTQAEADGKA
jgi:trigger factor